MPIDGNRDTERHEQTDDPQPHEEICDHGDGVSADQFHQRCRSDAEKHHDQNEKDIKQTGFVYADFIDDGQNASIAIKTNESPHAGRKAASPKT